MKIVHIACVVFVALMSGSYMIANPLHDWVKNSEYNKQIKKLDAKIKEYNSKIKKPIDLNVRNSLGQTPLMIAAQAGHDQIVIYLLEHNVDASIADNQGKTAFDYADKANGQQIGAALIKRSKTKDGQTLLTQTIKNGDTKHSNELIDHKDIDINKHNAAGQTPLHIAVLEGNQDIVNKLLSLCAIKIDAQDNEGNTPVHYACQQGNLPMVLSITNAGARIDIPNKAKRIPVEVIGEKNKQIPNGEKQAILQHLDAIKTHPINIKMAKQKCIAGTATAAQGTADTKSKQESGKTDAHNNKQQERAALEHFDPGTGETLLTSAACEGDLENVAKLLDIGAAINAPDKNINTPLLTAVKCYPQFIRELTVSRMNGHKHAEVIEFLLKKGASILIHDRDGKNPLHYAIEHENEPIVQLLLSSLEGNPNKAEIIDSKDKNGDTPLHYAAATSSFDLINWLRESGARVDIQNNAGKIPAELVGTKQSTSEENRQNSEKNKKRMDLLLSGKKIPASAAAIAPASAAALSSQQKQAAQIPAAKAQRLPTKPHTLPIKTMPPIAEKYESDENDTDEVDSEKDDADWENVSRSGRARSHSIVHPTTLKPVANGTAKKD